MSKLSEKHMNQEKYIQFHDFNTDTITKKGQYSLAMWVSNGQSEWVIYGDVWIQ